ncbi:MAG: c-type cytochrome domain-containing protein, partial [Pirellulales bacterium]
MKNLCISLFCMVIALLIHASVECMPASAVDFSRDIRPILSDRCFRCHGPDDTARESELRLDLRSQAIQTAIVPGDAEASELFQ